MKTFPGYYRGRVEGTQDPEERMRYRVRVFHVHPEGLPVEHLPWAETISAGGKGFGDFPHYEVGDLVAVVFEQGNRQHPAILGGWFSQRLGTQDLPPEMTEDYNRTRRRWGRTDRAGNLIEMSELGSERHIRLKSGKAELLIKQGTDSIDVTARGTVRITAQKAAITAVEFSLDSEKVSILARDGDVNIFSSQTVNLYAGKLPGVDMASLLDIGQYVDGTGVTPRQTGKVRIGAQTIQVGEGTPTGSRLPTTQVSIEATGTVLLDALAVQLGAAAVESVLKGDLFRTLYNAHTHTETGGTTTAPVVSMPASMLSTKVKAE